MPVKQEQVMTPEDEILTRYYMNTMPVSGNAPISLMAGVSQQNNMSSDPRWNAADIEAEKAYGPPEPRVYKSEGNTYGNAPSGKPVLQASKTKKPEKVLARGPVREDSPIDSLYNNMQSDKYESKLATDRGMGLTSGLNDQQKIEAAQIAFDAASPDEVAQAKQEIVNTPALDEKAKKNPEDLTMAEKLAMIAMAVAPAIAGYAMHGEKGAYIGGIAGMKGVHETAVTIENQQSQARAQSSKERIAGAKSAEKSGSTATVNAMNAQGEPEIMQKVMGKDGRLTLVGTGVAPVPQVGIDSLGNPIVKTPSSVGSKTQTQTKAPEGVATSYPKDVKTATVQDYNEEYKSLTGSYDPFLTEIGHFKPSEIAQPQPGELPSQTKARIAGFENMRKTIEVLKRDLSKAKTTAERDDKIIAARERLAEIAAGLRKDAMLSGIKARGEEARKTAKFKSALTGISGAKDEKMIRDNGKKFSDETKNVYQKLINVEGFKNAKDGPAIAALFNSYMKLVQQDESVVRESDVALVQSLVPYLDNIDGWKNKIINEPAIGTKVKADIIAAAQLLGEGRMLQQIKMNNAAYNKARELKVDPRKVVDQGIEYSVKDFAQRSTPELTNAGQVSQVPEGRLFRVKGKDGVVFQRLKNNTIKTFELP